MINSYSDVHIVGHSLGAHVSGIVGFKVSEDTKFREKIGRISGLDPARPLYQGAELNLDEQLDSSDAEQVDVTHTNAKQIGLEGKYSHLDFNPNGGEHQTDCREGGRSIFQRLGERALGVCSHLIVADYWARSITDKNITACKADSWAEYGILAKSGKCATPEYSIQFGENAPKETFGKYYFDI